MSQPLRILVGTPVAGAEVTLTYFLSLWKLREHFQGRASLGLRQLPSSFLPIARNAIVTMLLEDESYSHLLFVDADMGFEPTLVGKMLTFDKPMVAVAYPKRELSLDRFAHFIREGHSTETAQLLSATYMGGGEPLERQGDFFRVQYHAGAGVLLIKREALAQMAEKLPNLWGAATGQYTAWGITGRVFQPFSPVRMNGNIYASEDVSFFLHWTQACGGELWVCGAEPVLHVGPHAFVGHYARAVDALDKAKAG